MIRTVMTPLDSVKPLSKYANVSDKTDQTLKKTLCWGISFEAQPQKLTQSLIIQLSHLRSLVKGKK